MHFTWMVWLIRGALGRSFISGLTNLAANANRNLQGNDLCGYSAPSTPDLKGDTSHKFSINGGSCSEVISGSITTGLKGKNAGFSAQYQYQNICFVYTMDVLTTWCNPWQNLITWSQRCFLPKQLRVMDNPYSTAEDTEEKGTNFGPLVILYGSLFPG